MNCRRFGRSDVYRLLNLTALESLVSKSHEAVVSPYGLLFPFAVLFSVILTDLGAEAGTSFYEAAAQVVPVVLIAALVEAGAMFAAFERLERIQDDSLRSAFASIVEAPAEVSPLARVQFDKVKLDYNASREQVVAVRDTARKEVLTILLSASIAEGAALYVLATSSTGKLAFGLVVVPLALIALHLYWLFAHRFVKAPTGTMSIAFILDFDVSDPAASLAKALAQPGLAEHLASSEKPPDGRESG